VPELPEVEVVRRGLERWVVGRTVAAVQVRHPRAVRRHLPGPQDFADRITGQEIRAARRRGKYLWLPLVDGDDLVGHLGMSGQLLVADPAVPDGEHLRVRLRFSDGPPELRFVDQRTFGGLYLDASGASDATAGAADAVPASIRHIARDPLDPAFDDSKFAAAVRRRRTGIKRALLDQTLVSGVGNIYADEALWRARLHWARPTETLTRPALDALLGALRAVLTEALGAGGTSFDSLYVNVDGESGYFDRSLAVYGRAGEPCLRCGTPLRREAFMNRSSHFCPRCQPRPRRRRL
jgi:formamidopyrimidine-DNA glycosylase